MSRPSLRVLAGALIAALCVVGAGVVTEAQRGGFNRYPAYDPPVRKPVYDGQFIFTRLRYGCDPNWNCYYHQGRPPWGHGAPDAEDNLMRLMNAVSLLQPHLDASNIVAINDPAMFKFPVVYVTEATFWAMQDDELKAMREYWAKGGFVIFDDFRDFGSIPAGGGWGNFANNIRRILPNADFINMSADDPIFHCFFDINRLDIIPQYYDRGAPQIMGLYEDNNPKKRLLAILNFNTDTSQFWEFSATSFKPVSESNEAYKLGINYIIYGLTH